jgi:hypothetical protein
MPFQKGAFTVGSAELLLGRREALDSTIVRGRRRACALRG